jgi:hypothetical protein
MDLFETVRLLWTRNGKAQCRSAHVCDKGCVFDSIDGVFFCTKTGSVHLCDRQQACDYAVMEDNEYVCFVSCLVWPKKLRVSTDILVTELKLSPASDEVQFDAPEQLHNPVNRHLVSKRCVPRNTVLSPAWEVVDFPEQDLKRAIQSLDPERARFVHKWTKILWPFVLSRSVTDLARAVLSLYETGLVVQAPDSAEVFATPKNESVKCPFGRALASSQLTKQLVQLLRIKSFFCFERGGSVTL